MMSARSAFTMAGIKNTSTSRKGLAAMMVTFCRLDSASLPPDSSRVRPIIAVITPHTAERPGDASERPFCDMEPITVDAESAEVMKNVASRIIATMPAMNPPGS